jgi:hypothetical protein
VGQRADNCGQTVAELAGKITCWRETIEAAQEHGVLPMLHRALSPSGIEIPPDAAKMLRSGFEQNAFQCFANAGELLQVLKIFEDASIPAMPFKGVVLGASAYGDMTARAAGDLDVLIHFRDLLRATRLLKKRGYELNTKVLEHGSPEAKDYFEYHFERADDGMVLELRWRLELTQPRYRHDLGLDWVWPGRRTVKLAGADVPIFDPVSGLLMLCMHGSKHVWSRLIWVCDVARLLQSEPGFDWTFAQREAKHLGLWRCLALGVLLARRLADAQVPADVVRSFEKDRTARKLARFLQEHLVEEPGRMPDGRVPYNVQLLGLWERTLVILSPTFLRPNARDRAVVKLPKALALLYYVIRPFRLLLDQKGR